MISVYTYASVHIWSLACTSVSTLCDVSINSQCLVYWIVHVPLTEPAQYCDNWSLESGWVAEEALALLPPKVMERTELLDCYHSLLMASLLKAGIALALVGVIKLAEAPVSVMATILIGELLHLVSVSVGPRGCEHGCGQCIVGWHRTCLLHVLYI